MNHKFPFTQFLSIQKTEEDSENISINIPLTQTSLPPVSSEEENSALEIKKINSTIESSLLPSFESETKEKTFHKDQSLKTFENYIVGPSSQMAYRTLLAASQDPGSAIPAIYLHSSSGNGKGHLTDAFIDKVKSSLPYLRIETSSGKQLTTQLTEIYSKEKDKNLISKRINELKFKYTKNCDVFIFDNIHELKNKSGTQSLFLQIFNELFEEKKQIILTSDFHAYELDGFDSKLLSKLNLCLIVGIGHPDLETRISYLKKRTLELDIYLPNDVIIYIAENIVDSVRSLENALSQLNLYSSLMGIDIDLEIAKAQLHLNNQHFESNKNIEFQLILESVAKHYEIPLSEILSDTRKKNCAQARHVAMYLSYELLGLTFSEVGSLFNKKNHTSVIYAISKIKNSSSIKSDALDPIRRLILGA